MMVSEATLKVKEIKADRFYAKWEQGGWETSKLATCRQEAKARGLQGVHSPDTLGAMEAHAEIKPIKGLEDAYNKEAA